MISIVMPIYKANPEYLKESIDSIVSQTYRNWELIIIIDRYQPHYDSKLLNMISSYKRTCKLRCVINNERLGMVASLNKGVLHSQGEFIARMDHDDISEPERLELQLERLQDGCVDFVGSWATLIDETGKKIGELRPPHTPLSIRKTIMFHNPFLHPTMMFRKKMFPLTGLYDSRAGHGQDYELYMRLIHKGFLGVNIPKPLLKLRESTRSVTRGSGWIRTRLDYILVKALGFAIHGFHSPLDFLFLTVSPLTLVVTPQLVRSVKRLTNMLVS